MSQHQGRRKTQQEGKMSDELGWNCHHAVAVNGETYISLADAAASFQYYRNRIAANDAEIARLRAEVEAQANRNFETELRFWGIVDQNGLTGLPSDMWEALAQLVKDRAALALARKDARERAAKRLEELLKNHSYNPQTGTLIDKSGKHEKWPESAKAAILEHDTGYWRALAEGAAWIRLEKDREP